ncbi:hypothetical protein CFP56_038506 [Quercus suber]|uniref:Uncharacterized protein n=1 Tax=Quercus suber TaxID=58331 RepID=A0AAW0J1Z0_QUESU
MNRSEADGLLQALDLSLGIAIRNKKDAQKVKDTETNFRWSQPMQNLLLEILADEALHGNKKSNTFKHASYAK